MRYLPILIDTSASMGSLDNAGGTPRLEEAKNRIRRIIDNLLPDQRVSLIAMSSTAKTLVEFTDNRKQLHTVLNRVEVEAKGSRPIDALRMAQALGRTYPISNVVMFSDGNIPERIDLELPFNVDYQKLPEGGNNLGIAGINARRKQKGWEVFVRVESGKGSTSSGVVELLVNEEKIGEEKVSLDPSEGQRLEFLIETTEACSVECRLRPDGFDSLEADNAGYLELPMQRPLVVSCAEELTTFRRALKTFSQLEIVGEVEAGGRSEASRLSDQRRSASAGDRSGGEFVHGFRPGRSVGTVDDRCEACGGGGLAAKFGAVDACGSERGADDRRADERTGGDGEGF